MLNLQQVALRSTGVAAYVLLEARGIAGFFSDNAFLMLPGREYTVDFRLRDSSSTVTPEQFQAVLSLRSLSDVATVATGPAAADKEADVWMAEGRREVQGLRGAQAYRGRA